MPAKTGKVLEEWNNIVLNKSFYKKIWNLISALKNRMKPWKKYTWRTLLFFIVTGLMFLGYIYYLTTIKSVNRFEKALVSEPYDIIIVPGFPFHGEQWEDVMRMRVVWSAFLYKKGIAKNVIYSGSSVYSPFIEAKIMALYGEALGIDSLSIFTETNAEHSTENVYYSYNLAKKLGFNRIAVATDPFQTAMLEQFVDNELDGKLDYVPIVFNLLEEIDTISPIIDPQKAKVDNFESIKERESFWKRLKGTMGKNIDK